ncbi:MAG: HAMP domain-containing sensor histidine kinase [Bacteroidota bacterium]
MGDNNNKELQDQVLELKDKLKQSNDQVEQLGTKLLKAESQRSSFLSHILNEINNPLTSILGLTKNIRRMAYSNPELVHEQANLAFEQAFELDYKMRNLFAAAAIEAGTVVVQPCRVQVSGMLHDSIQDLYFKSKRKDISVTLVDNVKSGQYLTTDPGMFHAICLNLIGNAIEFSSQNQLVKIDIELNETELVFSISDQGPGISKEDQKVIFSRFKQLDEGIAKAHQGTGLGLSIVKEYTELLGGTLRLDSELDMGSTFTLILPHISNNTEDFEKASFEEDVLF